MSKTNKKKLFLSILIILSVLISLSSVSAINTNDSSIQDNGDLSIQDSIDEISQFDESEQLNKINKDSPESNFNQELSNDSKDISADSNQDLMGFENYDFKYNTKSSYSNALKDSNVINVTGSTFQDIQDAIDRANDGDILYLKSYIFHGNGTAISINKPLTIIGSYEANNKSHYLDAYLKSRILYIDSDDVTLINIHFDYGGNIDNHGNGGAIYLDGTNCAIVNCSFKGNHAWLGGAIFQSNNSNDLYVGGCKFVENNAQIGAGITTCGFNCLVSNCSFENNSAVTAGAIMTDTQKNGDMTFFRLENSTCINNNATGGGGAINFDGYYQSVYNCKFIDNYAKNYGGAIYGSLKPFDVSLCQFYNNYAKTGGAIRGTANYNVSDCRFINNSAHHAGAVFLHSYSNVIDSYFENNYAEANGGAICTDSNTVGVIIKGSTLIGNNATTGSAIMMVSSRSIIENCNFSGNIGKSEGAIYSIHDCNISHCIFDSNQAEKGGAFYIYRGNNSNIDNCRFINNSANSSGGAIYWYVNKGKISNSYFEENQARDGSAIYCSNVEADSGFIITDCDFINNHPKEDGSNTKGGAIYLYDQLKCIIVANSTFEYNYASRGGAIYVEGDVNLIANSTFKYNKADIFSLSAYNDNANLIVTLRGYENYMNAIYAVKTVDFHNVTYWDGEFVTGDYPIKRNLEAGINIILDCRGNGHSLNVTKMTNSMGEVIFDEMRTLPSGTYAYQVSVPDNSYYTAKKLKPDIFNVPYLCENILGIDVADISYDQYPVVNITANYTGNYTVYIANSSYDVTFTDQDVERGRVLGYNITITDEDVVKGEKLIVIPHLFDIKDGYGAYVQLRAIDQENVELVYIQNRTSFNVYKAASALEAEGAVAVNGSDIELNYMAQNGTVTIESIKKDGSLLENGTDYNFTVNDDKIIITGLDAGHYIANLTLIVDDYHNSSSIDVSIDVLIKTSIDVADSISIAETESSLINATLSPEEAGLLNYQSDNETVAVIDNDGRITGILKGNATIFVSYAGNEDYSPSNATVKINVYPLVDLKINKTANVSKAFVDNMIKFTVSVVNDGPSNASGVYVDETLSSILDLISNSSTKGSYDGNKWLVGNLNNGESASLTIVAKINRAGIISNDVTVKANEADSNQSNNNCSISIEGLMIETVLTVPNVTSSYNMDKNFTISLKDINGNPIGDANITVDLNGKKSYITDSNGQIKLSTTGLAVDTHVLNVTFAGNYKYNGSSSSSKIVIIKDSSKLNATDIISTYNDDDYLIVSLTNSQNNPIAGANVSVDLAGKRNYTTDSNGQIKVSLKNLIPDNYNASIAFGGNENYTESSTSAMVTVKRAKTSFNYTDMNTVAFDSKLEGRVGEYFKFKLLDNNGKPIAGRQVFIGFNGVKYNRTTNETGEAQLQINLKYANHYTFAIAFLGDDCYSGSFNVALISVTEQTPVLTTSPKTYKSSAKTKVLTATLKSSRESALPGKKVTFTINGKVYSANTNEDGIATVKVSLSKKGTYSFTVQFGGDSTYKKITKSSKLTIK